MRSFVLIGMTSCLLAILGLRVGAEEPAASPNDSLRLKIVSIAERPPDPQTAREAARARLTASINRLERLLGAGAPDNANRWREWLDLPALQVELARPRPDLDALQSISQRYYKNQPGLELDTFLTARRDLSRWLATLEYSAVESPPALWREWLLELADCTQRLDQDPTDADGHRAGALIVWLESLSHEGAQLAGELRQRYCQTNLVAQASGRFVNVLLKQDVNEQRLATSFVLGSYTSGTAYTQGHVSFGVVPSPRHGALEIRLNGRTACPANTSQRRNITVHGSTYTNIQAQKQLLLDEDGLEMLPATAHCVTQAFLHDVNAPRRFVERIAWRKATSMVPQAEAAASDHVAKEARTNLDKRANGALGGVNEMFRDRIVSTLTRLDALPKDWRFWSDQAHLRTRFIQNNDSQLAVAGPAPQLSPAHDVGIGAHASMVNNLAEAALGGETIPDQIWLDMLNVMTGTSPRALWVHDRAERWSVTLAPQRPLLAEFDEDRLGFALRITKVTRGERTFEEPVEVAVRFVPKITPDGPALIRDGDVEIRFAERTTAEGGAADGAAEGEEQAELRAFLARKFAAVFPPELYFDGFVPPAGGTFGRLRQLEPVEFRSDRNWLTLCYQLTGEGSAE